MPTHITPFKTHNPTQGRELYAHTHHTFQNTQSYTRKRALCPHTSHLSKHTILHAHQRSTFRGFKLYHLMIMMYSVYQILRTSLDVGPIFSLVVVRASPPLHLYTVTHSLQRDNSLYFAERPWDGFKNSIIILPFT